VNAFELLENDHKRVSQLFKEIESASGQGKLALFSQLKKELDVHAHVEETIFYPVLEKKEESRDITLEAYEEHKVVKDLLAELAAGDPQKDEWTAKFTVLKENVEHHVEEEEGELFDKAEDVLSDEQIEQLGSAMEAEKRKVSGRSQSQASRPVRGGTEKKPSKKKKTGLIGTIANLIGMGSSPSKAKKGSKSSKAGGTKRAATTKKAAAKKKAAKKSSRPATRKVAGKKKTVASRRAVTKKK
jgi:hemerythrin superfamily protein